MSWAASCPTSASVEEDSLVVAAICRPQQISTSAWCFIEKKTRAGIGKGWRSQSIFTYFSSMQSNALGIFIRFVIFSPPFLVFFFEKEQRHIHQIDVIGEG